MSHLTWLTDTTFDPYNQTFILAGPDGTTAYPASVGDILTLNTLCISQSIIFGIQVGITGLLAVILMLMTKRDKRQSAVFLLNAASLLAIFIRNVLACIALNSLFYNFYNWELHYYPVSPALTRAMDINATAEVLGIIINALIYSSLVLQIRIVCCTLTHTAKIGIVVVSAVVAFTALTIRFALAVLNIEYNIFGVDSATAQQFQLLGHVAKANNVITVVAIAFFSAIFVVKLAFAIHLRRKLNMKQFGPMQIIFVMGCQTMFVPRKYQTLHAPTTRLTNTPSQSSSPSSATIPSSASKSTASSPPSSPSSSPSPACGLARRRPTKSSSAPNPASTAPSPWAPQTFLVQRPTAAPKPPTRPTPSSTTTWTKTTNPPQPTTTAAAAAGPLRCAARRPRAVVWRWAWWRIRRGSRLAPWWSIGRIACGLIRSLAKRVRGGRRGGSRIRSSARRRR